MKQTFLLQEVIDDIVNTDKSLAAPLFKLNYFGRLIKNQELIEYTQSELNGYRDKEKVPVYRRTIGTLYIDMQAHYNKHLGQLPVSMIDEPYRQAFKYVYITEGIAAVEKLARETEKGDSNGQIVTPLPMEMLHVLQAPTRKLYKTDARIDVIGARLAGNASIVVEIPNAIRTKLLDLVMAIAGAFGYNIEIESFNKKADTNNQTIIHQMNTTIHNTGDGALINTGDNNHISTNTTIQKGDLPAFQKRLQDMGVEPDDIQEISEIVQTEQPDGSHLGPKTSSWIGKMVAKTLSGASKIGIGAAGNLLATAVKLYFGLSG
jgi:hypothetical protein